MSFMKHFNSIKVVWFITYLFSFGWTIFIHFNTWRIGSKFWKLFPNWISTTLLFYKAISRRLGSTFDENWKLKSKALGAAVFQLFFALQLNLCVQWINSNRFIIWKCFCSRLETRRQMFSLCESSKSPSKLFKSRGCGLCCKSTWIIFLFFFIFHELKSGKPLFTRKNENHSRKIRVSLISTQNTIHFYVPTRISKLAFSVLFSFPLGSTNFFSSILRRGESSAFDRLILSLGR